MQIPLGSTTENTGNIARTDSVDYIDNFYYENGVLKFIFTANGYIKTLSNKIDDLNTWRYIYSVKDYRRNLRVEAASTALNRPVKDISSGAMKPFYSPFGQSDVYVANNRFFRQCSGNELEWQNGLNQHDFNFRWYDQLVGRFTTMDPLAEKYYGISPYAYCANNPMRYVDPDGRVIIISGALSNDALMQLQSKVTKYMTLSMNEGGKVSYTKNEGVKKLKGDAKRMAEMIDDASITVNIITTDKKETSTGKLFVGGVFMGNTVASDSDENTIVSANQEVNPNVLGSVDEHTKTPGKMMMHEVTEAYEGAKISQKEGTGVGMATHTDAKNPESVYSRAHKNATPQSPIYHDYIYDSMGNMIQAEWYVRNKRNTKIIIQTFP